MELVWLKRIGIGFVALFLLLAIYALVMGLYFYLRKKRPYQKYMPEISAVIITVAISIVVKAVILGFSNNAEGDPFKPAIVIIRAVYDSLGGLAFEGLSIDINDINRINESAIVAVYLIYVGTTLLSALTFVSVITAKASYEVYSRLRLGFSRLFIKNHDTYIFMGLTKETLEIAKSLLNQQERGNQSQNNQTTNNGGSGVSKKTKPRIIFTGNEIPNFDRHNELCAEVMANNFLYISGNGNKQKSIAARLRLNKRNNQGRFVVFAFVADKHIPAEETNMDIVVSDVKARINGSNPTKDGHFKDQLLIEYFILTKRDINYQAYQSIYDMLYDEYLKNEVKMLTTKIDKQIDKLDKWTEKEKTKNRKIEKQKNKIVINIQKFYEKSKSYQSDFAATLSLGPKGKSVTEIQSELRSMLKEASKDYYLDSKDKFSSSVAFNVWNEASAIADSMTSFLNDKFAASGDQCVYVWSLGFGQTAQAICKELYVQTARIDKDYNASEFFVDAFDTNTKNISGILAYEEPMSIYLSNDEYFFANNKGKKTKSIEDYIDERKDKIDRYVQKQIEIMGVGAEKKQVEQQWEKEYKPFAVNLHDISCLDKEFLKSADGYTGVAKSVDRAPQYIVVATGDDYRNIRIVNALVFDVLNEKARNNTQNKPQVIFVNVWDDKNNDLINTYDIGEKIVISDKSYQLIEYGKELHVVILGNNDKIYSGKEMISYEDYAYYHKTYEQLTEINSEEALFNLIKGNSLVENDKNTIKIIVEDIESKGSSDKKERSDEEREQLRLIWARLDNLWDKKSNAGAFNYHNVFAEVLDTEGDEEIIYRRPMFQEHQRWMRLHFVHGWEYNKKNKPRRLHNCLCPYIYVPRYNLIHDLKNVVISRNFFDKEQSNGEERSASNAQSEVATE